MRQPSPIFVLPRICANGSMIVSMPIVTASSMLTVSGFSMVTPASISSRTLRSRNAAVRRGQFDAIVDAQQFARILGAIRIDLVWPARIRISTMSVR